MQRVEPRDTVVTDGEHPRPGWVDFHADDRMAGVDLPALPRGVERLPKGVLRTLRRLDAGRLEPKRDPELGVAVAHRERTRDELAARRRARLVARLAPLREREDRQPCRERQPDEGAEREEGEPAVPAPRLRPGQLDRPLGIVTTLPAEHCAREDVVEDLPAAALVGPQDAVPREGRRDRVDLTRGDAGELRIRCLVCDLRARRRDEVVEEPGGDVALRGVERLDRALEVVGHDLPGAAEQLEGCRTQRGRTGGALDVPQPLHHELQVRSLDPARGAVALGDAETARAELDSSRADAVEDTLDEHVLGDDLLAFELAPALQGPDDRRPPGNPIEPVETQDVREQARDVAFEPVESRERVLAQ